MPIGATNGPNPYSTSTLNIFQINIKGNGRIRILPLVMVVIRSSHTIVAKGNKTPANKQYKIAPIDGVVLLDTSAITLTSAPLYLVTYM
ncbi:hypothetical protein NYE71_31530 [Bacillus sp. FSL K6-0273]|uniref:hypothetical protein n=1 Tax=Bacillus TaxID=1386 RepID=UPI0015968561|nr:MULTISPECIES: hypothetical protein [Bacillus cereus group]MDF9468724.1 hypothetical protein [Bacillus cereus]